MRFGAYCMKAESRLFISDDSIVFEKSQHAFWGVLVM